MTVSELSVSPRPRTPAVSRAEFDAVYNECILGRNFVEDVDYYHASGTRFWLSFRHIADIGLPPGAVAVDIGGGIMGVLLSRLLRFDVIVADVNERARADIESLGLRFAIIDLFRDGPPPAKDVDLVVLQEVIEHIPQPPYLVMRRIAGMLKPGGHLFITTPNGHRFRNLVYMALGKEILGIYRYPEQGEALGHQHEYTRKQMIWQSERAGFEVQRAEYVQDGWAGSTLKARVAWILSRPVGLIGYMRNSLFFTLRYASARDRSN
ncbi:class I SAM-dependent methyltransferase [Roseibacterium sp. SDUM158017]|uniref:class I SAM-dependent methyltransferase n=1 Tax=Roseicyclus salinarum TaxID=3036773 RepID=UPI0024156B85|nr:class I SAM-dependent methyltransferase [Roseibacterium sp. SDUM158017]MDG4649619.1 class I SAM-dependent methyltransferase [Roseibacterium sp. SDUM158017]